MGERVEQVQKMIKSFENSQKRIARKYNDKDIKNEIKDIDNALDEINQKLKVKDLHIQRLEEQLQQVSPSERDLVEEYKNAIEKAKSEYEEEKQNSGMQKYLDKKEELSIKLNSDKTNNEKLIKQEVRNAEDKLRAKLTQEGIKLDNEINKTELNMKLTLADMNDFKYQYEEKNGARIATNGDEYREINEKYENLKVELTELKNAKQLCESKLQEFKDRDAKEAEKISKAWNDAKKQEDLQVETEKKETEQKMEPLNTDNLFQELEDEKNVENEKEEKNVENIENKKDEKNVENEKAEENKNDGKNETNSYNFDWMSDIKESKLVSININEGEGIVYSKTEDGKITKYDINEILKEKRKLYKNEFVKDICEEIAGGTFGGRILSAKVNPAIVKVLENNPKMLEKYIGCLNDKEELPFELTHDLRDSQLGIFNKMRMWVRARAENKIPGTKIIFANSRWNKNKTLPKAENVNDKEDILDGEYKEVAKERDMKEEIKVDNKDNHIEDEANRISKEIEEKMAENVKNMINAADEKGK